jgi:hypothetical protein
MNDQRLEAFSGSGRIEVADLVWVDPRKPLLKPRTPSSGPLPTLSEFPSSTRFETSKILFVLTLGVLEDDQKRIRLLSGSIPLSQASDKGALLRDEARADFDVPPDHPECSLAFAHRHSIAGATRLGGVCFPPHAVPGRSGSKVRMEYIGGRYHQSRPTIAEAVVLGSGCPKAPGAPTAAPSSRTPLERAVRRSWRFSAGRPPRPCAGHMVKLTAGMQPALYPVNR